MIHLQESLNKGINIKDMLTDQRPREKMLTKGVKSLSDAELLAIIIRTGTKKYNAIELSTQIFKEKLINIRDLYDISIEELCSIDGIGLTKATQIKAAIELGVRASSYKPHKYKIKVPWDIYKYYMEELRYAPKEIFKIVLLNTKNEIITDIDISIGTLNSSLVHPREVFREAIRRSSNKIILIHNHPSGCPTPSAEDKVVTNRLVKCGDIIGIEVIDHIIIGDGLYFSFKENMLI